MNTICTKKVCALLSMASLLGVGSALAGDSPVASTPDVAASQLGEDMDCTKEYSKSGLKNLDLEQTGGKEAASAEKKSGEGS